MKQNVEGIVFGVLCDEEWHSTDELCEAVDPDTLPSRTRRGVADAVETAVEDLKEHFSISARYKDGSVLWKIGGK